MLPEAVMLARVTEFRLFLALLLLTLVAFGRGAEPPAPAAAEPLSSRAAIEVAEALVRQADSMEYRDPRLSPTTGFVVLDETLVPGIPGLRTLWKITEHEPARYMKTIEVLVRWSRPGRDGEVVVTTVKAS